METDAKARAIILAITGASGAAYGIELTRRLLAKKVQTFLLVTETGRAVFERESGQKLEEWIAGLRLTYGKDNLIVPEMNDFSSPIASGSFRTEGMIVAPCSMGTLGRIAGGISSNLLERAADVCLKESRPLVLLARETPLSAIHLENMLRLSRAGAVIMPPVPAFYAQPHTIEDIVKATCDRVLDRFNLAPDDMFRW
jgi:4-hydroxy-3-polyprenylbenzoate decarboxylase